MGAWAGAQAAGGLVHVGLTQVKKDADLMELAAWTQVCRAILNLGEVITRN